MSSLCCPSSYKGGLSANKKWLRGFLFLKLVTVLLFQGTDVDAHLPLLVGCVFSLQALLLLRSSRVSTKPSTVFLGQLALTDGLVLLNWSLRLGRMLAWWSEEEGSEIRGGLMKDRGSDKWKEAVSLLCQQLLGAHYLASLLLLGLLGLEAILVLHWPQQTQTFRTSHWAQFGCKVVWIFVLLELIFVLQTDPPIPRNSQTFFYGSVPLTLLTVFSSCLKRTLWLLNLWLHYVFLCGKPNKTGSSFH